MKEPMFRFKVLVNAEHFSVVYVVAQRYESAGGELLFWAEESKIATFAAGEWIAVIVDKVIDNAPQ